MTDEETPMSRFEILTILKRCSEKNDVTEWNEWMARHSGELVSLAGLSLRDLNLDGAIFNFCDMQDFQFNNVSLNGARFHYTKLQRTKFRGGSLQKAVFANAKLQNAQFSVEHMDNACFTNARMQEASFNSIALSVTSKCSLNGAMFNSAKLNSAIFDHTSLTSAIFFNADLQDAIFHAPDIRSAILDYANVSGAMIKKDCLVDSKTSLVGVNLDSMQVDPGIKLRLEYNIRRKRWEEWYKNNGKIKSFPVRLFWRMSDYGISTLRIIALFIILSLLFAILYALLPEILQGFMPKPLEPALNCCMREPSEPTLNYGMRFIRGIYFSVVTMTTLGFGDIHASCENSWKSVFGHVALTCQVLLGYVMLGALITRLGILFTSGGPAAPVSKPKKEKANKKSKSK